MTLAERVHQQVNEILEKGWPETCQICEPLNPIALRNMGFREGDPINCLRCNRSGRLVKQAHELGDRWVIQRP